VPAVHTPATSTGVVGGMGHLLVGPGSTVPAVLHSCTGTALLQHSPQRTPADYLRTEMVLPVFETVCYIA
jgi:hypothetical protein